MQIFYGSEGKSLHYQESALLNYRKKSVWDLHIQDTLSLIEKYEIDGVILDHA